MVLCSNHISNLDPPLVGITTTRQVYFYGQGGVVSHSGSEWFDPPFWGFSRQARSRGFEIVENSHSTP